MLFLCSSEENERTEYVLIRYDGEVPSSVLKKPIIYYLDVEGEHQDAIMKMLEPNKLPNGLYGGNVIAVLGEYMGERGLKMTFVNSTG